MLPIRGRPSGPVCETPPPVLCSHVWIVVFGVPGLIPTSFLALSPLLRPCWPSRCGTAGVVSRGLGATRGPKGTRLFNSKPLQDTNPRGWRRSKSNAAVLSGASRLRRSVGAGALWRPSRSQARGRGLGFPLSASACSAFPGFVQVKSGVCTQVCARCGSLAHAIKVVESLSLLFWRGQTT